MQINSGLVGLSSALLGALQAPAEATAASGAGKAADSSGKSLSPEILATAKSMVEAGRNLPRGSFVDIRA